MAKDSSEGRISSVEVRLHGRGGQGVVKAAEIIVRAAVTAGHFGISIPFFGFERQGAPVTAFVRISDRPIRPKTRVYEPDCLVVMHQSLLDMPETFKGLAPGAGVIVNASLDPERLGLPRGIGILGILDASRIALETLGRDVPNTAMLGAFCAITGAVELDALKKCVADVFGEGNALAVQRGYEGVHRLALETVE